MKKPSARSIRTFARWLLICIAGVCLVVLFGYVTVHRSLFPCKATVHGRVSAPGGIDDAIVYEMACGATVPFNTQIAIVPAGSLPKPKDFPPFLALKGQYIVEPKWLDATNLLIAIPDAEAVYFKHASSGNVMISYR